MASFNKYKDQTLNLSLQHPDSLLYKEFQKYLTLRIRNEVVSTEKIEEEALFQNFLSLAKAQELLQGQEKENAKKADSLFLAMEEYNKASNARTDVDAYMSQLEKMSIDQLNDLIKHIIADIAKINEQIDQNKAIMQVERESFIDSTISAIQQIYHFIDPVREEKLKKDLSTEVEYTDHLYPTEHQLPVEKQTDLVIQRKQRSDADLIQNSYEGRLSSFEVMQVLNQTPYYLNDLFYNAIHKIIQLNQVKNVLEERLQTVKEEADRKELPFKSVLK